MMKRETRTHIADPADGIRAAFDMFMGIVRDPDSFPDEFNGATLRPIERVEGASGEKSISFEIRLAGEHNVVSPLPEIDRVSVDA